jgi:hypothetical protein
MTRINNLLQQQDITYKLTRPMRYAKFQSTYMENMCFNGVCLTAICCCLWLPWVDDVVTDKDELKSKITL